MKRLVALSVLLAVAAGAEEWAVEKRATQMENGDWLMGCFAFSGMSIPNFGARLQLWTNSWTVSIRSRRGESDPLRPILVLAGARITAGQSRPSDGPGFGIACEPNCMGDPNEYRFAYQIGDESRVREAWSSALTVDSEDSEFAAAYWADWPDELFQSDGTTSVRFRFSGMSAYLQTDEKRPFGHHTGLRLSYTHGKETLGLLNKCLDDHERAGRLVPPVSEDTMEAARSLSPHTGRAW